MQMKYSFYSLILTNVFFLFSLPLMAWECCSKANSSCCDSSLGIAAEARVAYYHPTSKKVRRIYRDGWVDYQFELSKSFKGFGSLIGNDLEWRIWTGVSGFSRKGDSIHFHDDTRLQLIPVSLGLKVFYPIFCNVKAFIGGAACYSFLRIHDDSNYVHKHVHKENWGGLIQSGLNYQFCNWGFVSVFFDYFFQRYHFHDKKHVSSYNSCFIKRSNLNMNGYKVGVGLGVIF